jgi:ABC-type transport system involved in multi-copper enzyme maturation permease subunit
MSTATVPHPETAPSALSEDQVSFARTVGMTGLMAVCLGILVLILNAAKANLGVEIANNVGFAGIVVGMAMMFFHASRDTDQLVRRLYGYVGGLGLPMSGLILSVLPMIISAAKETPEGAATKPIVSLFFPFGWACFLAGLFFLMPFCRNETDEKARRYGVFGLGIIGGLLALVGLGGGLILRDFGLTYGAVLALIGLGYLVAFINQLGGADLDGMRPALAVGALGLLVFAIALIRSLVGGDRPYFIPDGLVMITLGIFYMLTCVFMASDLSIVVLTRRELIAYFCSPVAYILLFMSAGVAWWNYNEFLGKLFFRPLMEPIVLNFYLTIPSVVMLVFMVPALTMRAISEEKRTGTYEVLMCAPVSETPVVISKFLAALIFYMLIWGVWLVFLLDLRVEVKVFEYRPLITFYLMLLATGASFVAMGVFFSALTRNQIVAAALTFFGMIVWLVPFFVINGLPEESTRYTILSHLSFVHLWLGSLSGRLYLRDLIIQGSIGVFWLFLTVKVLEARRWS